MFGTIYITSDVKVIENVLYTRAAKVVVVDEENPFQMSDIVTMGSILLPPYEALAAMIDGEMQIFQDIYFEYLRRPMVEQFLVLLITCLYRGINLVLFIPDQEADFIAPLLGYFCTFGIRVGTQTIPFDISPNIEPLRQTLMYMYGFSTTDEYLRNYPSNVPLPEQVLPMLINDLNPHLDEYSKENYLKYFEGYRVRLRGSNKPLQVPFMRY